MNRDFVALITSGIAKYLKIPNVEVVYQELGDNDIPAFYIPECDIIHINLSETKKLNHLELTSILVHEMRHVYQAYQVRHAESSVEDKELIKRWKYEFNNYKNPLKNKDAHINQYLEIDAVAFTAYFFKKELGQNLIIPEIIYDQVQKRIKEIEIQNQRK